LKNLGNWSNTWLLKFHNFLSKYLNALLNAPKIDVALFTFSHIWLSNVSSESIVFADDTKIFRNITDGEDKEILQDDLENLGNWSNTWLLKFHPEKCKHMNIARVEPGVTSF
jgi:hypothetical protein